ncbi:MAG TPA: hypothetical protein PKA19_14090 [Bacillota bacterium]|nr:hypothetical protein [Bacillota bacterium]
MRRFDDFQDQKIYDAETIRERARHDVRAEIAEAESKKSEAENRKRERAQATAQIVSILLLVLFGVLSIWTMSEFIF